jgi:hypothetical protein
MLNSKFFKTKIKLTYYFVLIGVFNFWAQRLITILQAFTHSCFPFLDFLNHVIFFYKYALKNLMETYAKPLNIFFWNSYIILTSLRKTMSKTCALKTFYNTQSLTIDYGLSNYHGIQIFWAFILHISKDFFVNPYSFKKFCKFLDNVCPKVLDVSNKPL